jgi:hypothetical protein
VEYPALIEPLLQKVRNATPQRGVLLAIHDWSTLAYPNHRRKTDRRTLTHKDDVGYDLATVLVVNGDDGRVIAPVSVSLAIDGAILTTQPEPVADVAHIDQIRPRMDFVASLGLKPLIVHVIDREADSVGHWRDWSQAGYRAVVRADDRLVMHEGRERKLVEIAGQMRALGQLKAAGQAQYHGRKAWRFVGETSVVLHRPAKRWEAGRQREIPGDPLPLRLVVVELRDAAGRVLARWLLLTNVAAEFGDAATVADWYYYRWRIEGFHKLLKSAGFQLEDWLQENGERLLRKLLLVIAACVSVWELERREDESSESFKRLLVALSGRQTKRGKPITTTALLAGLWVLQQSATWLSRDSPDDPKTLLERHLPLFAPTNKKNNNV